MQEFLLLFRKTQSPKHLPSRGQFQNIFKSWQDWMDSIATQDKLSDRGHRFDFGGATVHAGNVVVAGPYAEASEITLGYIMVRTNSLEDATELAKNCPVLLFGGNVEIRGLIETDNRW